MRTFPDGSHTADITAMKRHKLKLKAMFESGFSISVSSAETRHRHFNTVLVVLKYVVRSHSAMSHKSQQRLSVLADTCFSMQRLTANCPAAPNAPAVATHVSPCGDHHLMWFTP